MVYSQTLPASTLNSKKVPFTFKEDLHGIHHQQSQEEKLAAMRMGQPVSEAM
jgi:hypothetical protein